MRLTVERIPFLTKYMDRLPRPVSCRLLLFFNSQPIRNYQAIKCDSITCILLLCVKITTEGIK